MFCLSRIWVADLLTAHRESVKGDRVFPADGKGASRRTSEAKGTSQAFSNSANAGRKTAVGQSLIASR